MSQEQIKESVDRSEKEQLKYTRYTKEEKYDYRKNIQGLKNHTTILGLLLMNLMNYREL